MWKTLEIKDVWYEEGLNPPNSKSAIRATILYKWRDRWLNRLVQFDCTGIKPTMFGSALNFAYNTFDQVLGECLLFFPTDTEKFEEIKKSMVLSPFLYFGSCMMLIPSSKERKLRSICNGWKFQCEVLERLL